MVGGAEDPRLVGSHLFRRSAQGRHAGGMTDTAGSQPPRCRVKLALSRSK
jgi:hypothetical protein